MTETYLLQDLAIVVAVAGVMTLLCHRLRQPVVLGYILAGLVIGPYSPPFSFVKDLHSIRTLAELGLVFLMFTLGLEFNLPKLRKVGFSAGLAALFELAGMMVIGTLLGRSFGWNARDSLFLGAILSIASTTLIVKVFTDLKMMREDFAQVVFGILVLEDIAAVVILSVLSGLASAESSGAAVALGALLKVSFFVILFLVAGLFLVPRSLEAVGRLHSREMTGICALGLCLSAAVVAHHFGFSVALGAFLMGAVIAASSQAPGIEEWIHPVRDMFSAIFFVAVGMMIEPRMLWTHKGPILGITAVFLAGKILMVSLGSFLAGRGLKDSFKTGVSLAQIGEFSFVIASLGAASKVTSDFLYPITVAVSSITAFTAPHLIRNSDRLVGGLMRAIPAPVHSLLEAYEKKVKGSRDGHARSSARVIFVKYVSRLLVYVALWVSVVLAAQVSCRALFSGQVIAWALAGAASLPLFTAISRYVNHLLLILITGAMASYKFFRRIKIHLLYNTLEVMVFALLGSIFLALAASQLGAGLEVAGLAAGMLLAGFVLKRRVTAVKERMEVILDEIFGLASSEPAHQSSVLAGQKVVTSDLREQIALREDSPAAGRSIRDLGVRQRSGATVVAVYREGNLIANPEPDTVLEAFDILVIWGSAPDRVKAKALLLGS
ncbi:MAG: hypothetical protein A3A86_08160 [Elusimicrobia bacterium RIFCSPLOWO2_01_FULL_60_11]|nr:MAG: hypothetical protein A3A86_08160 [Elusimicrobia bacterium RIFCSPLOWO2_01_FULL_60_11]